MPSTDVWSPSNAATAYIATCSRRQRTWTVTPGYASLPKDELPINPYSDDQFSAQQGLFYQSQTTNGYTSYAFGPGYSHNGSDLYTQHLNFRGLSATGYANAGASATNQSLIQALGKVADVKTNLPVLFAEAGKTSDMILSAANRIDRAYRAFRRANFREVARLLNIAPNRVHKNWLEYKYGWMPTLMDVKGAAEFFAQQHLGRNPRFTVSSTCTIPFGTSITSTWSGYMGTQVTGTQTITGQCRSHHKLWLELTNPTLSAAQQLGLTNPALVAWELVPYSFVFDWFISVGDWLTALSALNGVTLRKGMNDAVAESSYTLVSPEAVKVSGSTTYKEGPRSMSSKLRVYRRSVANVDITSLSPPVKHGSLGFQKLVTSLALVRARQR